MSEHVLKKSEKHEVKHDFTGPTSHFYTVKSGETGVDYSVVLKMSCTCMFMSAQGIANASLCSHMVSVMRKIGVLGAWK